MVEPVGAVLGDAPRVRRDRGTADQQGAAGYQPRRARRHPRADAAEPLRRRLGDEPRRDRRPAAHAARRWPRDDRDDARLGGRAASPPPNGPARARRGGGFGWQRAARGDDPRGATYPSGNRPCGTAGEGRQPPGGTVDPTEGVRRAGQHRADPRQRVAFPNARTFDPHRFLGARPDLYQWIPFGGGTRRCLGAAFANMEMHIVLRTMLREVTLVPTDEPGERWHSRGVANAPAKGGRAIVRRRTADTLPSVAARAAGPATPGRTTDASTIS